MCLTVWYPVVWTALKRGRSHPRLPSCTSRVHSQVWLVHAADYHAACTLTLSQPEEEYRRTANCCSSGAHFPISVHLKQNSECDNRRGSYCRADIPAANIIHSHWNGTPTAARQYPSTLSNSLAAVPRHSTPPQNQSTTNILLCKFSTTQHDKQIQPPSRAI